MTQATLEESKIVDRFTSQNYLQFRFTSISHGKNIVLSDDGLEARRRNIDDMSCTGVYITTPLRDTSEFEVQVIDYDRKQIGSLYIGVVQCPRRSYKHVDIPHQVNWTKDRCIWYGDKVLNSLGGRLIRNSYGFDNLEDLQQGDKVGMKLTENGDLYFLVNNINQGLAAKDVYREGWDIYLHVVVYGKCIAIRITKAGLSSKTAVCHGLVEIVMHYSFFFYTLFSHIAGYVPNTECDQGQMYQTFPPPEASIQFKFHPVTGENIVLFEDGLYARRIIPNKIDDNAVVYGSQPIPYRGKCIFEVLITEYDVRKWSLSIAIGVMRLPAGTKLNKSDVPRWAISYENLHYCVWWGGEVRNMFDFDVTKCEYGFGKLAQGE